MIYKANPLNVAMAAQALAADQLVGMPTETVYGLAANAWSPVAVSKIFALKGRPSSNPLIVHVADFSAIDELTSELTDYQRQTLDQLKELWPGSLTVVLPKNPRLPDVTTGGQNSVALRIPNHPVAIELIRTSGTVLAAPSANKSTRVSPTAASHVLDEFGSDLPVIIDGGVCQLGLESTVVSLLNDRLELLRLGMIPRSQLAAICQQEVYRLHDSVASPGQQKLHYSPQARVSYYDRADKLSDSTLLITLNESSELSHQHQTGLSKQGSAGEIAQNLYRLLREADARGFAEIKIERPDESEQNEAILDRLSRAICR